MVRAWKSTLESLWYSSTDANLGYHMPAVRRRDLYYAKLEDQRADALGNVMANSN